MNPSDQIADLLRIMARLRTPGSGCPWDLEQDFRSIAPYTIEEAYEVADAIERNDLDDLADELGDLLLQVVFHARMAEERDAFAFGDVVQRITAKMIRRHPHVFGEGKEATATEIRASWTTIKAREKAMRAARRNEQPSSSCVFFDDVPTALPALTRAVKLQARASTVGFDWRDPRKVLDKIREETREINDALETGDRGQIEAEIGDLFFTLANLARHVEVDPETATRAANAKFVRRFGFIERGLAHRGKTLDDADLKEMDELWEQAKDEEEEQT